MEKTKMGFWVRCFASSGEIRNALQLAGWMLAWAMSWAAVSNGIKHEWLPAGGPTFIAALISTGMGLGMILAYRRFLRDGDELQRKIQLDALALSLGVALVGTGTYRLAERAGVVADTDVSNIILLIAVVYSITVVVGNWRYS
jgi:hypothetical protein